MSAPHSVCDSGVLCWESFATHWLSRVTPVAARGRDRDQESRSGCVTVAVVFSSGLCPILG